MTRRIVYTFVLAFLCFASKAQTYEESMRYWNDGPLTWEDLNLKSPRDFRTCDLTFRWINSIQKQKLSWNTVQYTPMPLVALDKSVSWHNSDRLYPCALEYDQVLFDLNELSFRKMLTELYSKDNKMSSNELYSFYSNQSHARWKDIIEDTEDGLDSAMVAYHAAIIKKELAQTSYPDMMRKPGELLIQMGIGISGTAFLGQASETFRPGVGLDAGIDMGYDKHIFGLILSPSSGRLAKDFNHNGVVWRAGSDYNHNYVGFRYGYIVYDGPVFSICPFLGVSGRVLSSRQVNDNGKTELDSLSNTTLNAGADIHFKFSRILRATGKIEQSLFLKAFAARDFSGLQSFSVCFSAGYNLFIQ